VADGIMAFLAMLVVTSVSMIFGELVRSTSPWRARWRPHAPLSASKCCSRCWSPGHQVDERAANWIVRRLGVEPAEELRSARSPQELLSLVRNSARSGALDAATAALVRRSLQFGTRTAEELMTPRSKIVALQTDDTVTDLVAAAAESGFSRFPIVDGDLDETVGIVHVKQVFDIPRAERAHTLLTTVAQPVPVVPSTLDGDAVLAAIRATICRPHWWSTSTAARGHGDRRGSDRRDRGRCPR